jgi:hypothetical protein
MLNKITKHLSNGNLDHGMQRQTPAASAHDVGVNALFYWFQQWQKPYCIGIYDLIR